MDSATTTISRTARAVSSRHLRPLLELAVGYALILVVIWTPRPWQRILYFVAAAFILVATQVSFPGAKALGLSPGNFFRSVWVVAVALLAAAISIAVANKMRSLHGPATPAMFLKRYAGYMLFACVQQALLQDFFLLRLLRIMRRPKTAAVAAAAIFSVAHLPNPILTVVTFIWGLTACLLFLRYRNLYVLAITHAILGVTLAMSVPGPLIHNMRVGLGYLNYNPHRLQGQTNKATPRLHGSA